VKLEYEGVGSVPCIIVYQERVIRCGLVLNANRSLKRVRLWLVINDFLKFDLKQMFLHYDYL
jgi:hypothetical protein